MTSSDSCAEPLFDLPETSLTLYADSMEFALVRLGATVLVILGHTGCGAMEVACSGEQMASPDLTAIVHRIRPEGGATPRRPFLPAAKSPGWIKCEIWQTIYRLALSAAGRILKLNFQAISIAHPPHGMRN